MPDFIFDGNTKTIKEPVGVGDTTFDVARDVYSAWKRWTSTSGSQFDAAFVVEGGTPIGTTGLFTGTTFILVNGWKLMAADHDHQVILNGNIYSDDGIVSAPNPTGNSTLFVNSSVAAQGVQTNGGSQQGVWTSSEKNQLLSDTSTIKDQSQIAAIYAENELNP